MRKYRFFFHYNKPNNSMTVHFRGQCYIAKNLHCNVPVETKWSNRQPRLVMQGFCRAIGFDPEYDEVYIIE